MPSFRFYGNRHAQKSIELRAQFLLLTQFCFHPCVVFVQKLKVVLSPSLHLRAIRLTFV